MGKPKVKESVVVLVASQRFEAIASSLIMFSVLVLGFRADCVAPCGDRQPYEVLENLACLRA